MKKKNTGLDVIPNENKVNIEYLEFIFPLIHGLNINGENDLIFKNIIEARKFIDTDGYKDLIEFLKLILKTKPENIEKSIGELNLKKLKSSVTLFYYITNENIKNLLQIRNYEKEIIKIFSSNKDHNIFKTILEKYYNNELDKETVLIIESEMLEYSFKETTLNKLETKDIKLATDLLIKYSEICPLAISAYNQKEQNAKVKNFYKSLTKEEYTLFCKFNVNESIVKDLKKYNRQSNTKLAICMAVSILLISGVLTLNYNSFITKNKEINTLIAFKTSVNIDESFKEEREDIYEKIETSETNEMSETEEALEITSEVIEEKVESEPKPVETNYNYVEPTGSGNLDVVNVALSQVGNEGGYPYWSWYGFSYRVDWCGCFASWVANVAGISTDIIPKFARAADGASWFINNNLFRDRHYEPRPGDYIFFDYDYDNNVDHVGIVEYSIDGYVYTIEGNSDDVSRKHSYYIGTDYIYGYGTPNY